MTRAECIAIAFALGFALFVLTCVQSPRIAGAQGVTFDASHWGSSGAGPDFTGRVVRPVMLDTYLPADTTGWTTTTVACSHSAFEAAILAASGPTIIEVDADDCTLTVSQDDGVVTQIAQSAEELIIRGDADGNTIIRVSPTNGNQPGAGGHETNLFRIGTNTTPTAIQTWTWDGGYAQGSQILASSQAMSDIYDGDIVYTFIDAWAADASQNYRAGYKVLCARWDNSNVEGTDCTGITGDNQIKIDRELPFQMDGAAVENYFVGTLTGHVIHHIERRGECADAPSCGTVDKDQVPYRVGFERLTIEHTDPITVKDFAGAFDVRACFECWLKDVHVKQWGNSGLETGSGSLASVDRLMILSSRFTGPYWAQRCSFTVNSITAGTPASANITVTGCTRAAGICGNSLEPLLYFPDAFAEAGLQSTIASCTCTDCTADTLDVDLYNARTGAALTVSSGSTPAAPNDWAVLTKNYGIAAVYFAGQVSQSQVINTIFDDTRVGFIQQQGAGETVLMGNYCTFSSGAEQVSRCFFRHGGHGAGSVWERNDSLADFTTTASATQWEGAGPNFTHIFNRGREYTLSYTHQVNAQCPGGGLCNEGSGHEGNAVQTESFLGNFYEDVTGAVLDQCFNDSGGLDCSNPGPQVPFFSWYMGWSGNVVYGETLGGDDFQISPANPTSTLDDYADGDAIDTRPAAFDAYVWPTSLAYDRDVASDAAFSPAWWCNESGAFHEGMGAPADDRNAGSPSYSKLPAQIRLEGGTCTPLAAGASPAFRIHGGSFSGGTLN